MQKKNMGVLHLAVTGVDASSVQSEASSWIAFASLPMHAANAYISAALRSNATSVVAAPSSSAASAKALARAATASLSSEIPVDHDNGLENEEKSEARLPAAISSQLQNATKR